MGDKSRPAIGGKLQFHDLLVVADADIIGKEIIQVIGHGISCRPVGDLNLY